jgi:hypothetical protein
MLDKLYWKNGLPSRAAEANSSVYDAPEPEHANGMAWWPDAASRLPQPAGGSCPSSSVADSNCAPHPFLQGEIAAQLAEWEPVLGARRVALLLELARRQADPGEMARWPGGWIPSPVLAPTDSRETRRQDLALLRVCGLIEQVRVRWGRSTCMALRLADPLPAPGVAVLEYLAFYADGPLVPLRRVVGRLLTAPPGSAPAAAIEALQRLRLAYRVTLDAMGNPTIVDGAPLTPPATLWAIARRATAPIPFTDAAAETCSAHSGNGVGAPASCRPGDELGPSGPGYGRGQEPRGQEPAPTGEGAPLYPVASPRPGASGPDPLTLAAWLPIITPRGQDLLLRLCTLELRDHPTRGGTLPPIRALARAGYAWMPARSTLQRFFELWLAIGLVRQEVALDGQLAFVVACESIAPSVAALEYLSFDAPDWIRRRMTRLLHGSSPQTLGALAPIIARMRATYTLTFDPLPHPCDGQRLAPGYCPPGSALRGTLLLERNAAGTQGQSGVKKGILALEGQGTTPSSARRGAPMGAWATAVASVPEMASLWDADLTHYRKEDTMMLKPDVAAHGDTADSAHASVGLAAPSPDQLATLLADLAAGLEELGALIPVLADPRAAATVARFTSRIGADLAQMTATSSVAHGTPPNYEAGVAQISPPIYEASPVGHRQIIGPARRDTAKLSGQPEHEAGVAQISPPNYEATANLSGHGLMVASRIGGVAPDEPGMAHGTPPNYEATPAGHRQIMRPPQRDTTKLSGQPGGTPPNYEATPGLSFEFENEIVRSLFRLFENERESSNEFDSRLDAAASMVARTMGDPHWRSFREPLRPLVTAGRWRAIDAAFSIVQAGANKGAVKNRAALLIATLKRCQSETPELPAASGGSMTGMPERPAGRGRDSPGPKRFDPGPEGPGHGGGQEPAPTDGCMGESCDKEQINVVGQARAGAVSLEASTRPPLPVTLEEAFARARERNRGRSLQEILDECFHAR